MAPLMAHRFEKNIVIWAFTGLIAPYPGSQQPLGSAIRLNYRYGTVTYHGTFYPEKFSGGVSINRHTKKSAHHTVSASDEASYSVLPFQMVWNDDHSNRDFPQFLFQYMGKSDSPGSAALFPAIVDGDYPV